MTDRRTFRATRAVLCALALVIGIAALAGCSSASKTSQSKTGTTAKGMLPLAISALSTTAPDGKLLVCQAYDAITPTSTPGWEYLIGSPKSGKVYAVLVMGGKSQFVEYGDAGLTAAEWKTVPSTDDWKIDSDVALEKARALYPNGKTAAAYPGFVMYLPKSEQNATNKPMTWYIQFDPATQGSAPTSTVTVDMKTGEAKFAE